MRKRLSSCVSDHSASFVWVSSRGMHHDTVISHLVDYLLPQALEGPRWRLGWLTMHHFRLHGHLLFVLVSGLVRHV